MVTEEVQDEEVAIKPGDSPRLGYGSQRHLPQLGQAHLWQLCTEALR